MFGSDNHQDQGIPTGAPVQSDPINNSNDYGQPQQEVQPTESYQSDPGAAFPPVAASPDPFGTAQSATPATDAPTATQPVGDDSLLDIKQQALQHLSPLVQHIDQPADEKFKTTMMMIQASDDKTLIPVAYEAAKQIEDDKARAQALLDLINEINYFTQQNS